MWESFVIAGKADETFVARQLMREIGGRIEPATEAEDIYDHVDFWWIQPDGSRLGVDVKGLKKLGRNDPRVNDVDTWIETMQVNGRPGWVYGKATYVAFRRLKSTLFVRREKLASWIESKIAGKKLWTVNPRCCYVPYRRASSYPPRLDIITLVPLDDLESIAAFSLGVRFEGGRVMP